MTGLDKVQHELEKSMKDYEFLMLKQKIKYLENEISCLKTGFIFLSFLFLCASIFFIHYFA